MQPNLSLRRLVYASCAALAALVIVACGGSDEAPPQAAGVSLSVGAAGGTLDGPNGVQLVVPAGALAQTVLITFAQTSDGAPALPAGGVDIGAMFALTPHGTTFALPVTIRLPFDPARLGVGETPTLWKTDAAQTGWEQVAGATVSGNVVQAQITSFSWAACSGSVSTYAASVTMTGTLESSTMKARRSFGYSGSSGT